MSLYLGVMIFSFICTALSIIPYIDLVFKISSSKSKFIFPPTASILLFGLTFLIYWFVFSLFGRVGIFIEGNFPVATTISILLLSIASFGFTGLLSELIYTKSKKPNNLVWLGVIVNSIFISGIIYFSLGIDFIYLPYFGTLSMGIFYILVAAGFISLFILGLDSANKIDGLPAGGYLISLISFWIISAQAVDTPTTLFISIVSGILVAVLYFNVYPARIKFGQMSIFFLGGSISVLSLLLGKPLALLVIGSVFIFLGISRLLRTDTIAVLQKRGWSDSKITMRLWLITLLMAVLGLWLS